MIRIINDGPRIVSTDYWSTEHARRGLVYLSINAGAVRLLLPDTIATDIVEEARCADSAVVSRGPWEAEGGRDSLEVLFEDGSDSPFALHLDARQADRLWLPADDGREVTLSLWGRGDGDRARKILSLPRHSAPCPPDPMSATSRRRPMTTAQKVASHGHQ